MKLIIEKLDGVVYAYMEREKLFRKLEPTRDTPLVETSLLNDDCDLDNYSDDFHMVFDIKQL